MSLEESTFLNKRMPEKQLIRLLESIVNWIQSVHPRETEVSRRMEKLRDAIEELNTYGSAGRYGHGIGKEYADDEDE